MLTSKPTPDMINGWKRIYDDNWERLKHNRKSGAQIDDYFRKKYMPDSFDSYEFKEIVKENMMLNKFSKDKLPVGKTPDIKCYKIGKDSVIVGIYLVTGFIHIECRDISKMEEIYDDLFVYRGLDDNDLTNYFLVAQYIQCLKK